MSSQGKKFDGRVTSSDWKEEYKDVEMLNPEEFDNAFFDVTSAAAASLLGGVPTSRQSSLSRPSKVTSGLAREKSTDSTALKYPPMPPLGLKGRYGSNARGISTESWFDPASLPAIENDAAQRQSTNDFINEHLLKNDSDSPTYHNLNSSANSGSTSKRKRSPGAPSDEDVSAPQKGTKKSKRTVPKRNYRPRTDSVPDTLEDAVEKPGPHDVAMGRGGMANNHIGNQRFRAFADSLKPRYEKLSKEDKTDVSKELVQMVHDVGGRFLAKEPATELWYEVDFKQARKKASQALREESRPEREARKAREAQTRRK